jgi:hypothetical protein
MLSIISSFRRYRSIIIPPSITIIDSHSANLTSYYSLIPHSLSILRLRHHRSITTSTTITIHPPSGTVDLESFGVKQPIFHCCG